MAEYRGRFSKENDRLKDLLKKFIDKYKKDNPGVAIGTNTLKKKVQELWGLDPQGKTTQRPTHKLSSLRKYNKDLFKGIKIVEGEIMYDPRNSRWSSRVDLKNQLEKFINDYKKKNKTDTIDTKTLANKVEDIFKVKNGSKVLASLRENNPNLFKGTNIVYTIKGQGPWNKAWENDPEFRKFFKEKNPGVKWEDIPTEKRDLKSNAWKSYSFLKERSKVVPKNYISLSQFAEKVGALPSYIKTVRAASRYDDLNSSINKIFKPIVHKREVFYSDPSKQQVDKFKELVQGYRESGIKSMSEKKQSVSYEPIRAIHKELIRDPDARPTELAEAIYGKANAKNLKNIGNDASMYVEFLTGARKVPGITAPTINMSENILGNILMPGSGFFNFGNAERRNAMLKERDSLLGITDRNNKLFSIRGSLVKKLKNQGMNIDEAMGLSATYEKAPGYSELAQVIKPEINYLKGNTIDKDFSRIFDKVTKGQQNLGPEIKQFNQDSKAFQKNYGVDTPIIEYKPGEKLDASKFVKNFNKLTPEAQANVSQLADQGIALRSKAMPMGALLAAVEKAPQACRTILNYQTGGISATCAEAIQKDPVGSAEKLKNLDAQSGPLAKVKNAALGFLKSPNVRTFGIAGAAGAIGAALVKEFRNDDPTTYLSNEDQQKSMLVDMATQPITTDFDRPAILDYQLPAMGATIAGSAALAAPSTIKASRSRALGVEKKGLTRTAGRVLGRGLGVAAAPGLLAPFAAADIASQISEGDSITDIATDPLNYVAPIFAEQTPKLTRGMNPLFRKAASLGLGKVALRGLSRAGIGGLALSLGIQGYNLLDD